MTGRHKPPQHGTAHEYTYYRCRCDVCRAGNTRRAREYKQRTGWKRKRKPDAVPHVGRTRNFEGGARKDTGWVLGMEEWQRDQYEEDMSYINSVLYSGRTLWASSLPPHNNDDAMGALEVALEKETAKPGFQRRVQVMKANIKKQERMKSWHRDSE